MSSGYAFVAVAYVVFGAVVWLFEARRISRTGPDTITIFIVLCLLQTCLAGIAIYAALPIVDPSEPTGTGIFDRIFQASDVTTALLVLCLTVWFVAFFYVGCALGRLALGRPPRAENCGGGFDLSVRLGRLLLVLAVGASVASLSFYLMGDSIVSRYTNLILFRSGVPEIERTPLNSNAFALTQTWGWLSVLALLSARERVGRGWVWLLCLGLTAGFALLGVSRRALFLPMLLVYLTIVLHSGRWRIRWIVAAAVPIVLLLLFGKEALSALAFGGTVETVWGTYQSVASAMLRAASDLGITIVESIGTLSLVHSDLRFGVDHVLSIMQRFPEGMLGLDFDFPERMVRLSTAAFADTSAQDVPPGLMGAMWLDFGVAGPFVWGLAFGLQMSVVQYVFGRTRKSLQAATVFVLLVFVVALPLNTGSFDFTFSVDILMLVAVIWWCVRLRPMAPAGEAPLPQES
jgi:hypothetical protein